jgi:hypothetical protein
MADLSRKRVRDHLAPRREPYWQRLAVGAYPGLRRRPDTWLARFRGKDRKQNYLWGNRSNSTTPSSGRRSGSLSSQVHQHAGLRPDHIHVLGR